MAAKEKNAVAITVDQGANPKYQNFTYAPTTLHRDKGQTVAFHIEQGDFVVRSVTLYFDQSPFTTGETEILIKDGDKRPELTLGQRGAFHYKAKAYPVDRERQVAFDMWCPSIIVD